MQYSTRISKSYTLKLGAYAHFKSTLNASRDIIRETFEYSSSSGEIQKDSVYRSKNNKGKIIAPATYGAGITIEKDSLRSVSAEYSLSQWADYRYYGTKG